MNKLILIVSSIIFLSACKAVSTSEQSTRTQANTSVQQMAPENITAVQDGKSDAEWNQSRGTISDGADTNATQAPTRILTEDANSLIVYFSR